MVYVVLVTQTRTTEGYIEANSPEEALFLASKEWQARATDSCKDEWSAANVDIVVRKA